MVNTTDYDAVIVGARCAGSATGMLLARQGHRVLVVDRATFPSDTLSTHIVWQSGVERLTRWGLADAVAASGCPPITNVVLDAGPLVLDGRPRPYGDTGQAFCVRRRILDTLLADAAAAAGAEVRLGTLVTDLVWDGNTVTGVRLDGTSVRSKIVIGADGAHSLVARAVRAAEYHTKPALTCVYYSYWSGVEVPGIRICQRPGRAFGYAPTNDGLTLAVVFAPGSEYPRFRSDVDGRFWAALDLAPEVSEVMRAGRREDRFHGTADLPNFLRVPHGPGWALVGDAGYHKDPVTAQGISDAFRDAELLAASVDAGLRGDQSMPTALAGYQARRDAAALPMYEMTTDMATLEPPPDALASLLGALVGRSEEISQFLGVLAGSVPVREFLDPTNVARIMAGAPPASIPA
jgi:2-polyprenyl-6-methoxyphenol hydroxylase-like FAD-dependent oxidoreductase